MKILHTPPYLPHTLSNSQLQLDAAFSSFSSQATDSVSLASMTLAGLLGKFAFAGTRTLIPAFFSHMASIGVEAGTFTLVGAWFPRPRLGNPAPIQEFFSHFINFSTFRLMASSFHVQNPLLQHASQSLAMFSGHQVAGMMGLEEISHESIAQQLFYASLSTLQIQVGSTLAGIVSRHRIHTLERSLENNSSCFRMQLAKQTPRVYSFAAELEPAPLPETPAGVGLRRYRDPVNGHARYEVNIGNAGLEEFIPWVESVLDAHEAAWRSNRDIRNEDFDFTLRPHIGRAMLVYIDQINERLLQTYRPHLEEIRRLDEKARQAQALEAEEIAFLHRLAAQSLADFRMINLKIDVLSWITERSSTKDPSLYKSCHDIGHRATHLMQLMDL